MTALVTPVSGRLLLRVSNGGAMVVGVVHLPGKIRVEEGVGYAALLNAGGLQIIAEPISGTGLTVEQEDCTVSDLLGLPIWPRGRIAGTLIVRFIPAFNESNGWAVFGVSDIAPPLAVDEAGHAWFDIVSGTMLGSMSDHDPRGRTMGEMLVLAPMWPDAQGRVFTVPQLTTVGRERMYRYTKLVARYGSGSITLGEYRAALARSDCLRRYAGHGNPDMGYARYLHSLDADGLLQPHRPMTGQDIQAREAAVARLRSVSVAIAPNPG